MTRAYKKILFVSETDDLFPFLHQYADVVTRVTTAVETLAISPQADMILFDLICKDGGNVDLLHKLGIHVPHVPIIVLADQKDFISSEVSHPGVRCIFFKPAAPGCLASVFDKSSPLLSKRAKDHTDRDDNFALIGQSMAMQDVYRMIKQVASSKVNVFIVGESGTGKELVAEAIHSSSPRRHKSFMPVNCSSFPRDLLESELFGYTKGAFTGATTEYAGLAVEADGGTLFLDEICDMPIELQPKLLRFLQSQKVKPLGSSRLKQLDIRFICATNHDPIAEIEKERFRADLYYRLDVVRISLPPLRERGSDILLLAYHFLNTFAAEEGKSLTKFDSRGEAALLSYDWPGNIRQLQNMIHTIVVLYDGNEVTLDMVEKSLSTERSIKGCQSVCYPIPILPLRLIEKEAIFASLRSTNNDVVKAAKLLEVSPSTIYRKLQHYENCPMA